jgi:hypothetical protein
MTVMPHAPKELIVTASDTRAQEIQAEISKLKGEMKLLVPAGELSSRALAKRAGISASTANRFQNGKAIDVPTAKKLIEARVLTECPCCGQKAGA